MHIRGTLLTLAVLTCAPPLARAQSPVVAGFQDGFFVQSADGDNRLVFGLVAQLDSRFTLNDPTPVTDTFTIRKMRPTLTGRLARYFEFKVMPDFGNGAASIQDAFLDLRLSRAFRIRAGKDKTPIGYELLIGDAYVLLLERSLASSLVPNRDVGLQALGDVAGGRLTYAAGVFNGIPDGTSAASDVDANNGKDLAGRLAVQPFRGAGTPAGALSGLGFHLGGSYGKETAALPSFRTSVGQSWFAYDRTVTAAGVRRRVAPSVFYYHGPFGGFAEYMRSTQRVDRAGEVTDVVNRGWDATASFTLTGEDATDRGVRPNHPIDPAAGTWGAWQLVARYACLTIDETAFEHGLAAAGSSHRARQYTLGVNWYPARVVKYYVNVERTTFDAGTAARPGENAVMFRAQVGF